MSSERTEDRRYVSLNWVAPKYFATFGTPLLAGRDFAFEDEGRPPVAIVNQAMARHYFGTGSPLGRHFRFEGQDRSYEIIGVVADAKYLNLYEAPATHGLYERLPGRARAAGRISRCEPTSLRQRLSPTCGAL